MNQERMRIGVSLHTWMGFKHKVGASRDGGSYVILERDGCEVAVYVEREDALRLSAIFARAAAICTCDQMPVAPGSVEGPLEDDLVGELPALAVVYAERVQALLPDDR